MFYSNIAVFSGMNLKHWKIFKQKCDDDNANQFFLFAICCNMEAELDPLVEQNSIEPNWGCSNQTSTKIWPKLVVKPINNYYCWRIKKYVVIINNQRDLFFNNWLPFGVSLYLGSLYEQRSLQSHCLPGWHSHHRSIRGGAVAK